MKPVSSLIGPNDTIILPKMSQRVDYEAEIACIVKNRIKNLEKEDVMDNLEGFTCFNDVTARDLQKIDGQWTRAKSFDTFSPIGPKIVKDIDPNNVKIECLLNDKVVQSSNTNNFIFKIEEIISFISKNKVEIRIEGIGTLENFVK
jgi:2-keto-4-pentenoate hydratase/2-oxohepta-3-ene-1,7-dioic acid hydratase in catechol pathway